MKTNLDVGALILMIHFGIDHEIDETTPNTSKYPAQC